MIEEITFKAEKTIKKFTSKRLLQLVLQLVVVVVITAVGNACAGIVENNTILTLLIGLATSVAVVFGYTWVVRRTEGRIPLEVARKGAGSAIGKGAMIGLALFGLVILNLVLLHYYVVNGLGSTLGALGLFGILTAAAVTEEIMFRGVLFRILEEWTGTWIALGINSVLFGLIHMVNPNASIWSALVIAIEAGFLLTAAYVATRRLWLPIGLHLGWNIAGGSIFSTVVSGNNTSQGLLDATIQGNTILTGGSFGPEASVFSIIFCVLTAIAFMWLAYRRGHVVLLRRNANNVPTATTGQ
jgi:membrane protease YdiL (CAAX protease family)